MESWLPCVARPLKKSGDCLCSGVRPREPCNLYPRRSVCKQELSSDVAPLDLAVLSYDGAAPQADGAPPWQPFMVRVFVWFAEFAGMAWRLFLCGLCLSKLRAGKEPLEQIRFTLTREDLENFRPSPEEASRMRAQGQDPYVGQRLNYLAGTNVPFEPLLEELSDLEIQRFEELEREFPSRLSKCMDLDRERFYQEPDRFTLLLFLQADKYNVEAAIQRLLKTMVWRQTSGFEDFVDNPDADAWALYRLLRPRVTVGYDLQGRPMCTEPLGEIMSSEASHGMPMSKWMICYAFDISLQQVAFRKSSILHNRPIHRVVYLGDLSGLSLSRGRLMIPWLRTLSVEVEQHFPECAGHAALFNAPPGSSTLFAIAKMFLDPRTASRCSMHSGVPREFFFTTFGEASLPVELGGKLSFPVPRIRPLRQALADVGLKGPITD